MEFERRGSVRVPCDLPSCFRIIDSIQDTISCFASDISNGGVKLVVRKFIRLTDRLILSLNISKYRTVEIRVAPAWIREDPAISSFYIGTRFVEISKEAKIAIQSFQTSCSKDFSAILIDSLSRPHERFLEHTSRDFDIPAERFKIMSPKTFFSTVCRWDTPRDRGRRSSPPGQWAG